MQLPPFATYFLNKFNINQLNNGIPYSTVQLLFLLYLWEILSYSIQRAYQQLNGHAIL